MALALIHGKMEVLILENLKTGSKMEKEYGLRERPTLSPMNLLQVIKEIINQTKSMVLVNIHGKVEIAMKVNISMMRDTGKEK
jgi:hypothetical protein